MFSRLLHPRAKLGGGLGRARRGRLQENVGDYLGVSAILERGSTRVTNAVSIFNEANIVSVIPPSLNLSVVRVKRVTSECKESPRGAYIPPSRGAQIHETMASDLGKLSIAVEGAASVGAEVTPLDWWQDSDVVSIENVNALVRMLCVAARNSHSPDKLRNAMALHDKALSVGLSLNADTYVSLIYGCGENSELAREMYLRAIEHNVTPTVKLYGTLIQAHVLARDLTSAFSLASKMQSDDSLVPSREIHSMLLNGLVVEKETERARDYFLECIAWKGIEPDEVMMSIMIKSCIDNSEAEKALQYLQDMQSYNLLPTDVTLLHLMEAMACSASHVRHMWEFFEQYTLQGYPMTSELVRILVRGCRAGGNLSWLNRVVRLSLAHGVPWNILWLIDGIGACSSANRMPGISNQEVAANVILAGRIFSLIEQVGGHETAGPQCMTALVELYASSDQLEQAIEVLTSYPVKSVEPEPQTFNVLLDAFSGARDDSRFLDLFEMSLSTGVQLRDDLYSKAVEASVRLKRFDSTCTILEVLKANGMHISPQAADTLGIGARHILRIHKLLAELAAMHATRAQSSVMRRKGVISSVANEHSVRLAAEGMTVLNRTPWEQARNKFFEFKRRLQGTASAGSGHRKKKSLERKAG